MSFWPFLSCNSLLQTLTQQERTILKQMKMTILQLQNTSTLIPYKWRRYPKCTSILMSVTSPDKDWLCGGFKGNMFSAKFRKNTILCLKYNTILTSYLRNWCIKSHLHSWYSGQNHLSCNTLPARVISYDKYDIKTHTGAFFAHLISPIDILNFRV